MELIRVMETNKQVEEFLKGKEQEIELLSLIKEVDNKGFLFELYEEVNRKINKHCGVYFIKNNSNGLIKIGKTKNIHERFKQLKSACIHLGEEDNLELLCFIRCIDTNISSILEHILHKEFKGNRKIGEWFNIGNRDIQESGILYDFNLSLTNDHMGEYYMGEYYEYPKKVDKIKRVIRDKDFIINQISDKKDFITLLNTPNDEYISIIKKFIVGLNEPITLKKIKISNGQIFESCLMIKGVND